MSNERLEKLREKMTQENLDAFLINNKANRLYLSGFTGTDGQVLLTKDEKFIIADGRYFEQLKTQSPDFTVVDNKMQMNQTVGNLLAINSYKKIGIEANEMNVAEYLELQKHTDSLIPTTNWIESLRMSKDDAEVDKIKKASDIADQTFNYIIGYIKPGMSEQQVANEIDRYGLAHGADGVAFETIVASGVRSALPHGHASNKIIEKNELVILDFGFMIDRYYSDITRTVAVGNISDELKKIYQITLDAQETAIAACELGKSMREIDSAARDLISNKGYGDKFLHGTGHGIGLTVHEYPLLNQNSSESIDKNMTFTIEPGIYLSNKGGVRIEDDILIDSQGDVVNLTHAPKKLIQIG